MAREIRNVITLDSSRFERGARAVSRWVDRLHGGLTGPLRAGVRLARRTVMALAVAVTGLAATMIEGTRRVLNYADELHNLSMQTGLTVARMVVLRQAFQDSNVEVRQLEVAIRDMQRRLVEAERPGSRAAQALGKIGIPLRQLRRMDPATQFEEIANAINKIADPAMRTYVASELLGRSGARVLRVFERGAVETAARSIGAQAELLEENAVLFSEAADILNRIGVKVRGFFVGVADKVVPALMPLLRRFDELDLAEQGQRFGAGIERGARILLASVQEERLGELIRESLVTAAMEFSSVMMAASISAAEVFVETFKAGMKSAVPDVLAPLGERAKRFFGGIDRALAPAVSIFNEDAGRRMWDRGHRVQEDRGREPADGEEGIFMRALLRSTEGMPERFERSLERFRDAMELTRESRAEGRANLATLFADLEDALDFQAGEGDDRRTGRDPGPEDEEAGDFARSRPAADSLAAIGLGGGLAGGIQEAVQESNRFLSSISTDISAMRERMQNGGGFGMTDDFGEVRL